MNELDTVLQGRLLLLLTAIRIDSWDSISADSPVRCLSLCGEHRRNHWVSTTAIADASVELDVRVVSLT